MAEDEIDYDFSDPKGPTPEKAKLGPPDRWMYCPPMATEVIGKHFLAFKTPLCSLYDSQVEKQYQFHPKDVFKKKLAGAEKGAKIGLWVDLTKTNRYYSHKEVERHNCLYKKLPLQGHGATPTVAETKIFCDAVEEYLKNHPNGVVGVHCTHGFNRTGYLIAAFLATSFDWAIDVAIQMFAKYRQGGIYKQDYIDELMKQYGDEDEDRIEAPPRPDWEIGPCTSYEPVDDDVNSSENGLSSLTQSDCKDHPQFMDGLVPCVTYVTDTTTRAVLQNKIKEMCGATKDGFPGSQPVSMERSPDRDNLKLLAENKYMVSWKADGVRYMVLINGENQVYAFDRDNSVFRIPDVSFPHRKENRHIRDTLVDAEMIIDRINDDSGVTKDVPRLLIYDIIKFEGQNVGDCDFRTRLLCIRKEIIGPRKEAMQYGRIRRELEPISIRLKDFWEIETVRKLFDEKFTHNVGHEIDGLIFQPIKEPYKPGRLDTLLKWKPPSHNSIDFKLQIKKVNKVGELPEHIGFLYVQHQPQPMCTMKATKKLLPYNNKIIECNFVNGQWNFMRERTDKSLPNSEKTALAVWNSMRYPIDKATLIEFVEKYCVRREQKRPSEYEHNSQHSKRAALTS